MPEISHSKRNKQGIHSREEDKQWTGENVYKWHFWYLEWGVVGYTRNSQTQQEGNENPINFPRQEVVNTDVNVR